MFINLQETNGTLETTSSITFPLVQFLREEKIPPVLPWPWPQVLFASTSLAPGKIRVLPCSSQHQRAASINVCLMLPVKMILIG